MVGRLQSLLDQALRSVLHLFKHSRELWHLLIISLNSEIDEPQFQAQAPLVGVAGRSVVIVSMHSSQIEQEYVQLLAHVGKLSF